METDDYIEMQINPNGFYARDDDDVLEDDCSTEVSDLEKIVDENMALLSTQKWQKIYGIEGNHTNYQKEVSNLVGRLDLCSNKFSIVLVDKGYKLICVIKDLALQLEKCLMAHMRLVKILKANLIIERLQIRNEETHTFVSLIVSSDNIKIIDEYIIKMEKPVEDTWKQLFVVQHVSTPFYECGVPICFVLVGFLVGRYIRDLWLVLKGNQVAWKDLLIPNREYLMVLPSTVPQDYFLRPQEFLSSLIDASELLKEIMHHPGAFPTVKGVTVPDNVTIYLQSNSDLTLQQIPRESVLLPRDAVDFISLRDASFSNEKILTVYGLVKSMTYERPIKTGGCALCACNGSGSESFPEWPIGAPIPEEFINPWETSITLSRTSKHGLELPNLKTTEDTYPTFDDCTPENLTLKLELEDPMGMPVNVYIKNWKHFMKPMGLSPGVLVLAKFVNRRLSQANKLYFMTCPFSSFQVLNDKCKNNKPWGQLGFPELNIVNGKSWGVVDINGLLKATIKATCLKCGNNTCLEKYGSLCQPATHALAVASVDGAQGDVKVYYHGDNVRIYLGLKECLWKTFCEFAQRSNLQYLYSDKVTPYSCDISDLQQLFKFYCNVLRPGGRRFISIQRIAKPVKNPKISIPAEYYCRQVDPVMIASDKSGNLISDFNTRSEV